MEDNNWKQNFNMHFDVTLVRLTKNRPGLQLSPRHLLDSRQVRQSLSCPITWNLHYCSYETFTKPPRYLWRVGFISWKTANGRSKKLSLVIMKPITSHSATGSLVPPSWFCRLFFIRVFVFFLKLIDFFVTCLFLFKHFVKATGTSKVLRSQVSGQGFSRISLEY